MPNLTSLVRHFSALSASDRELLLSLADNPHGPALSELIRRYAGAVQQAAADICPSSADDITQAVFVLLVQKAEVVSTHECAIGWLFETTRRLALKARTAATRRNRHERQVSRQTSSTDPLAEISLREVRTAVLEELARLPEGLQEPLLLCYWEGTTQPDAAMRLGCSLSTFKRRLDRGRNRLEARLIRRGFTGTSVLAALSVSRTSAKPVASALSEAIVKEVSSKSASVATILEEGAKVSLVGKMAALSASVLMVGIGLTFALTHQAEPQPKAEVKQAAEKEGKAQVAAKVKNDIYGDPLPEGAVARLGTTRFRSDVWVQRITSSKDGKYLFGAGWSSVIQWDAETGKEIRRFVAPRWQKSESTILVNSIAFSEDGSALAASPVTDLISKDPIEVFDANSGKHLCELASPKSNELKRIRFPDSKEIDFISPGILIVSDLRRPPVLWDINEQKEIGQLQDDVGGPASGSVTSYYRSFSRMPDGRIFGTGSADNKGFWSVWNSESRKLLQHEVLANYVSHVVSPDKKYIVLSCLHTGSHNEIRVLSADLKEIKSWRTHLQDPDNRDRKVPLLSSTINSVSISPSGKSIATQGVDGKVRQWELDSGKEIGKAFDPGSHRATIVYAKDNVLASAGGENEIRLWDARTGEQINRLTGAEAPQIVLAFSGDGRYVASANRGIRIWDLATSQQVAHLAAGETGISKLFFVPNSTQILWGARRDAYLWDWKQDKEIRRFDKMGSNLRLSPDGKRIAAEQVGLSQFDTSIRIDDVATGKTIQTIEGPTADLNVLIYSPDSNLLYGCSKDYDIRQWNRQTGKLNWQIAGSALPKRGGHPVGHSGLVRALALSPGGQWLYSAGEDKAIYVWEANSGRYCKTIAHGDQPGRLNGMVTQLVVSPDGNTLAAAMRELGGQYVIQCWDIPTGRKIATFSGHRNVVHQLVFSPDGKYLASSGPEPSVLIWEIPAPRNYSASTDLATLWHDLASPDPEKSYAAACRAVASGDAPISELRKQLAGSLKRSENESLRFSRSIEILEMIGSDEAQKLLDELASKADSAELKAEASLALKRIEQWKQVKVAIPAK